MAIGEPPAVETEVEPDSIDRFADVEALNRNHAAAGPCADPDRGRRGCTFMPKSMSA
jgi:hypothetical protein